MTSEAMRPSSRPKEQRRGDVLVEFIPFGQSVKVCAVDPVTGTEVITIGPANIGREQLTRMAVRKLNYVMKKQQQRA